MPTAELIVSQPGRRTRRVETSLKLISIGRKDDNTVALPGDQSVSRYHAVIKQQPDGFWLIHLSESSSTLVNDQPVQTTRRLAHGDLICVGGSSTIEFLTRGAGSGDDADDGAAATPPHAPSPNAPPPSAPAADLPTAPAPPVPATPAPASGGFPVGTLVGVVGGLAVVALVAVLLVSFLRPDSGDAASSSDARPSRSSSSNADSGTRADSGADARANDSDAPTPEPPPPAASGGGGDSASAEAAPAAGGNMSAGPASAEAVAQMADKLAVQLGQKSGYRFDPAFVALIKNYIAEYRAAAGFSERARKHQTAINDEFINQGLPPLLGYATAMSRTKFTDAGAGGVWGIPAQVVRASATGGGANAPDMSDPAAAARVAATHFKELLDVFGREHFVYAVACYGLTLDEAGRIVSDLERRDPTQQLRFDFWRMKNAGVVKGEQVERVARFFAAGVVGENPQAFGLRDQPLSKLF